MGRATRDRHNEPSVRVPSPVTTVDDEKTVETTSEKPKNRRTRRLFGEKPYHRKRLKRVEHHGPITKSF